MLLPCGSLTPWLTGAGARSAEGTNIGHENAEGMAYVGVRVEPTVRLGSVGTVLHLHVDLILLRLDMLALQALILRTWGAPCGLSMHLLLALRSALQ